MNYQTLIPDLKREPSQMVSIEAKSGSSYVKRTIVEYFASTSLLCPEQRDHNNLTTRVIRALSVYTTGVLKI